MQLSLTDGEELDTPEMEATTEGVPLSDELTEPEAAAEGDAAAERVS